MSLLCKPWAGEGLILPDLPPVLPSESPVQAVDTIKDSHLPSVYSSQMLGPALGLFAEQ